MASSASAISALSVISSSSCAAGKPVLLRMRSMTPQKRSLIWCVETFTLNVGARPPNLPHRATVSQACPSTQAPSGQIIAIRSAMGMKTVGDIVFAVRQSPARQCLDSAALTAIDFILRLEVHPEFAPPHGRAQTRLEVTGGPAPRACLTVAARVSTYRTFSLLSIAESYVCRATVLGPRYRK
jgi:hypothetical protein